MNALTCYILVVGRGVMGVVAAAVAGRVGTETIDRPCHEEPSC